MSVNKQQLIAIENSIKILKELGKSIFVPEESFQALNNAYEVMLSMVPESAESGKNDLLAMWRVTGLSETPFRRALRLLGQQRQKKTYRRLKLGRLPYPKHAESESFTVHRLPEARSPRYVAA
ncbi:MAG: hypothetical protein D3909_04335 [Candidatus Electrothrix sp. ATG1]|nr:hypothetical protein [Candidatus Electrothrix sp. ATG1]MCI5209413.1 hypothetical protein [Candidatus Electrothrix sp. ATG2]